MNASTHVHTQQAVDKAVFPIENDSLGRLIALVLHSRLFGNEPQRTQPTLRELGWADSLVDEMSTMPIDDVAKVLGGPNSCVGLVFDHRKAASIVNSYRALRREQRELEYFLVQGATPGLIQQLFPSVSTRTVTATRRKLGVEVKRGRPPLPDTDTSEAAYRCWQALGVQEPNLRARYVRLKKHFPELSFATLCLAIEVK
jgi:hypothetical protein